MQAPTLNPITQQKHGSYNAVDYSAKPDPTVYAPEDGTISAYLPNAGDGGNTLQLTSGRGTHGLCHLEKPLVTVGQKVSRGQAIGVMGYTGLTKPKGPDGRHLHWVFRQGNTYIYPPSLVDEQFKKEEEMKPDANQINQLVTLCWGPGRATKPDLEKLNSQATMQDSLNLILGDDRTAAWDKRVYELEANQGPSFIPVTEQLFKKGQ